jgi:N-acetyl-gamma-glutamylphosphate reductase
MLPDGMRKGSIRRLRSRNQTTSATAIDFVQSHTQAQKGVVSLLINLVKGAGGAA